MTQVQLFAALVELTVCAVALICLLRLFRAFFVDSLREQLFAIREELFDFAAEGNLDFANPSYGRLRLILNSLIRFADHLSGTRLILLLLASRFWPLPESHAKSWELTLEALAPEQRERLKDIHGRAMQAVTAHLMKVSPVLWILFAVYVLKGATVWAAKKLPGVEMLETQAVVVESARAVPVT